MTDAFMFSGGIISSNKIKISCAYLTQIKAQSYWLKPGEAIGQITGLDRGFTAENHFLGEEYYRLRSEIWQEVKTCSLQLTAVVNRGLAAQQLTPVQDTLSPYFP